LVTNERRSPAAQQVGQYQLIEEIGRGGMAIVYRAHHPGLGIDVAIKVISTQFAADDQFVARFRLEAQSVARLRHPNILQVYDFGEDLGTAYLVSQFVDGGSLWDKLGSPLPTHYVNQLATKIASALDYAHSHGILHRDIKPGNILLTKEGDPILADFGLAKILERPSHLTDAGTVLGSPEYMSPEQALGHDIDERSDVYSLAVVIYEMLTGSPPFECETPTRTILAHAYDPLPSPRLKNPNLTEQVERVLIRALAKDPGDRYQQAGELVHALKVASITLTSKPRVVSWPPQPIEPMETTSLLSRFEPAAPRPTPAPLSQEGLAAPVTAPVPAVSRRRPPTWIWPLVAAVPIVLAILFGADFALRQLRSAPPPAASAPVTAAPEVAGGDPILVVIAPFDDSFASRKINVGQRISDRLLEDLRRQGIRNVELLPLPGGNSVAPKIKALEVTREMPSKAILLVWGWYDDGEVSPHVVLLRGYVSPEVESHFGSDTSLRLGANSDEVLNRAMPASVSDQVTRILKAMK
jgi:serine/threonine protein kinase